MEKLNKYRKRIDELDKVIMEMLEERMNISREIGKYKLINNIDTLNSNREAEILKLADKYKNSSSIKDIYKQIFINSKKVQDYKFFLVGKTLEYSFSPEIYKLLGINDYNLFTTDDFSVIKNINFTGINITNPYKVEAYKICDSLDESALLTKVVNTIIRKDNKLIGYNTDYYGFSKLLDYNKVDLKGKKVIIIGNGATANTITKVLLKRDILNIVYLVRNIRGVNEYLIDDFNRFKDYEIIINATPYGTYPNNQTKELFSLEEFNKLETLIDVVYNPKKTPLLLTNKKNLKKINGLMMLVAQAAKAASIYSGIDKLPLIEEVYKKLNFELSNIVLIGMPFSGKSIVGKKLEAKLNHKLVDLDLVMEANKQDLPTILKNGTLKEFRALEEEYAIKYSKERGRIISTGGGIVLSNNAMNSLRQNGIIVFLDIPLEELALRMDDSRPLIKSKEDLIKLYNERIELYNQYSDIIITSIDDIDRVLEKIYEYISY